MFIPLQVEVHLTVVKKAVFLPWLFDLPLGMRSCWPQLWRGACWSRRDQKAGHKVKDCREKPKGPFNCYNCNKVGHIAKTALLGQEEHHNAQRQGRNKSSLVPRVVVVSSFTLELHFMFWLHCVRSFSHLAQLQITETQNHWSVLKDT